MGSFIGGRGTQRPGTQRGRHGGPRGLGEGLWCCGTTLLEYSYSKENRPEEEDLKSNQIEFLHDISVYCEGKITRVPRCWCECTCIHAAEKDWKKITHWSSERNACNSQCQGSVEDATDFRTMQVMQWKCKVIRLWRKGFISWSLSWIFQAWKTNWWQKPSLINGILLPHHESCIHTTHNMRIMRYSSISPVGISVTVSSQTHPRTHRQFGVFAGTPQERHPPEAVSSQSGFWREVEPWKSQHPLSARMATWLVPIFWATWLVPLQIPFSRYDTTINPKFWFAVQVFHMPFLQMDLVCFFPMGIWIEVEYGNTHAPFWLHSVGSLCDHSNCPSNNVDVWIYGSVWCAIWIDLMCIR